MIDQIGALENIGGVQHRPDLGLQSDTPYFHLGKDSLSLLAKIQLHNCPKAIHCSHENATLLVIAEPTPVEPAKCARSIGCRLQPNRREKALPVQRGDQLSGIPDVRRRQTPISQSSSKTRV